MRPAIRLNAPPAMNNNARLFIPQPMSSNVLPPCRGMLRWLWRIWIRQELQEGSPSKLQEYPSPDTIPTVHPSAKGKLPTGSSPSSKTELPTDTKGELSSSSQGDLPAGACSDTNKNSKTSL